MKKNEKKIRLKKRAISNLTAKQIQGGAFPTTSLISVFCPTQIYAGEDLCIIPKKQR